MFRAIPLFVSGFISGVEVNAELSIADAYDTFALSTIFAAIFGYPAASAVTKRAANLKSGTQLLTGSMRSSVARDL